MRLPTYISERFSQYAAAENDEKLFQQLSKNTVELISFFDEALDDETWREEHLEFFTLALSWFTKSALSQRLSHESIAFIAKAIHRHVDFLDSLIVRNLSFIFKEGVIPVNSLLLAYTSSYFAELIRIECFERKKTELKIPFSYEQFLIVETFASKGTVDTLWRYEQQELFKLLRTLKNKDLIGLQILCEETLKRYIDRNNVVQMLLKAHGNHWEVLETRCCELINDFQSGLRLEFMTKKRGDRHFKICSCEFMNLEDATLSLFHEIDSIVSQIVCGGILPEEAAFEQVLKKVDSLDISRTRQFHERMLLAPVNLTELDLQQCPWLTHAQLSRFFYAYPQLEQLSLAGNTQLSYQSWSELQKLKQLTSLDISKCQQITDEDLGLILKACSQLTDLNLEDCQKISEKGFFELAKLNSLINLNLSRTNLSNAALGEIAFRLSKLKSLSIAKCGQITEKGIMQVLRQSRSIKELDIKNIHIKEELIKKIKMEFSEIKLII